MQLRTDYLPRNDGVFTFMIGSKKLFEKVASVVLARPLKPEGTVVTQAERRENAIMNKIVFDGARFAPSELITLDMQRSFRSKWNINREVYYTCRAVSTQAVEKMRYDKLKPVHICFIMSEYDAGTPVQRIALCDLETKERYTDLLNITNVYVPTVLKTADKNSELYILASFYAITDQNEADRFEENYGTTGLGKELISMYLTAIADTAELDRLIEESLHYKLTEVDIAEFIAEGKAEGIAEGEVIGDAQGEARTKNSLAIKMIGEGLDSDLISRVTGFTITAVEKLKAEHSQLK